MKRTLLALLGVLVLSLAGSVSIAQTDYGNTNDPPAADQPTGSSTSDVTGSQSADSPTSPTTDPNDPNDPNRDQYQNQDPNRDPNAAQYQNQADQNRKALPATGSNDPLALVLGLSALGGAAMLRVFRLRRVQ
jgi:LPXTG-motif cell wall-anchored protein